MSTSIIDKLYFNIRWGWQRILGIIWLGASTNLPMRFVVL